MSALDLDSSVSGAAFDVDAAWQLHPKVSLRPEPFGALLYHFGTRKLSFLKNTTIVEIVQALPEHGDARSAMRAAGVPDEAVPTYARALGTLAQSHMIVARPIETVQESR